MNYTITKGDHDGFTFLNPRALFASHFTDDAKFIYDTEYAYYKNKLYKQIETQFPNAQVHKGKLFLNKNRDVVDSERVYLDFKTGTLIAIKLYWEGNDCPEINLENGYESEEDEEIINVKSGRYYAKLTLMMKAENPEIVKFFSKIISKDKKPPRKERELNIICYQPDSGFYLKGFKTNKVDIDLNDNYNDDFIEVSNAMLSRLKNKKDNGIILLHSEPGCGKTSYLRYLTQQITNKRLIYLPPDLTSRLAEPDFMVFLLSYPDSILFIEDAEEALESRGSGKRNPAVSNLLNNSDGLLGDALRLQVVCTFNCPVNKIDSALMRPGRLIAEYRFLKLTAVKSTALIFKLYGDSEVYNKQRTSPQAYTLAEIYNLDQKKYTSTSNTPTIGFKQ